MVAKTEHCQVQPSGVLVLDVIEPSELRPEGGGDADLGPLWVISHNHEHRVPETVRVCLHRLGEVCLGQRPGSVELFKL